MGINEKRRTDLEQQVARSYDLLAKLEDKRRVVGGDPMRAAELDEQIKDVKGQILICQDELNGLDDPSMLEKYLKSIIEQNTYLSPRGVMQTRRSVSLPLEEVFITLEAEQEAKWEKLDYRPLVTGEGGFEGWLEDPYARSFVERGSRAEKVDLGKILREQSRVVILGDPGAGKTTLMRFLALQFAKASRDGLPAVGDKEGNDYGAAQLPILLRISDYADALAKGSHAHLRDFLAQSFANLGVPLGRVFNERLDAGGALILLDGLDEVIDRTDRSLIAREIESFISAIDRRNRVIVTSRIAGYRESPLDAAFSLYTLRDLEVEQIEKFLDRWCAAAEKFHMPEASESDNAERARIEIDGIMQAVKNSPGVKRLASNPLMLTILALIHRNGARLPNRRVELYELATKTLLEDWQLARGIPSSAILEETEAMQILAPLAFWMHSEKTRGVASEGEVRDKLTEFLAKRRGVPADDPDLPRAVDDFLRRVREFTGIFVERAPRYYGFMHLTFEEYFAARHMLRLRKQTAELVHRYRHQSRWEETILLAIAYLSKDYPEEAAELIRTAVLAEGEDAREAGYRPSVYEDLLHRDLLLAAQCIGDCAAVETGMRRTTVKKLIDLYFSDRGGLKYQPLREKIIEKFIGLGGSDAEKELVEALVEAVKTDAEAEVRCRAAWALGSFDGNKKRKIDVGIFSEAAETFKLMLAQPGFEEPLSVTDKHCRHQYDAIWEALWNICQKQGIV